MAAPGIYYRDLHNEPDNPNSQAPLGYSAHNPNVANSPAPLGYSARNPSAANSMHSTYGSSSTGSAPRSAYVDGVMEGPYQRGLVSTMEAAPTDSHALATQVQPVKGLVQQQSGSGAVRDLGWNEPKEQIPAPLVGGLQNEDLWILIRRFNKQMYHVKEMVGTAPGNLDMNVADEDEFSPDKLRSTVERLYMTVIIGLFAFVKHIVRLRSWRESQRTTGFCTAYFIAWFFDFLTPLFATTLIALIAYPPSRPFLFPPAPLALVSSSGTLQKPKAGVLGSHDSATGAPENHRGEAVELEAANFFNSIAHIALASATGKHPQNEPASESGASDAIPDPTAMALGASDARTNANGGNASASNDKTKVPMEAAMWSKMRPIMHGIGDVADTWERFANALDPTPPFPADTARLRIAGLVVPMVAAGLFITSYMFVKGVTFGVGFGFFGEPVIMRGVRWLNRTFPHWQKLLEIRNTILLGVPTSAQLTLTLLRVGEAHNAPLPPPPRVDQAPPNEIADVDDEDLATTGSDSFMGATPEEIAAASAHDPNVPHQTAGSDIDASKSQKHGKKGARVLNFFKQGVKGVVEASLGADRLKASVGSEHAKNRLGAVTKPHEDLTSGPVDFKCRYGGKKGHVYINSTSMIPTVAFTTDSSVEKLGSAERHEALDPKWTFAVTDVKEIKKIGGFGWKAKLVVGWVLDREIADGMEIVDRRGQTYKVTAMPLRDELFNRLIAIGGQKWESW